MGTLCKVIGKYSKIGLRKGTLLCTESLVVVTFFTHFYVYLNLKTGKLSYIHSGVRGGGSGDSL